MGRKKIVPKKLGSVKIPKNLRRMGDKALADPQVANIVSGALASVGALVAGRDVVQVVADGAPLTKELGQSQAVSRVSDLMRRAFEDILKAREPEEAASGKRNKAKKTKHDRDEADSVAVGSASESEVAAQDTDRLH